jgi:hypothetical protein
MVILFAGVMVLLVFVCALAVDTGRVITARAQLQNAVDAAALAGASQLVGFVDSPAKTAARAEAVSLAMANQVVGTPLVLETGDIGFGRYDDNTRTFVPESAFGPSDVVDSIEVMGRRTEGTPGGPIDLFFAPIFGIKAAAHARHAVATQPRRYVVFVMDRSGSMCYDTTDIALRQDPNADGSMSKSPTGWYWMPRRIYTTSWQTAWFCAKNDATGQIVTDFLPSHIRSRLLSGAYFRYCSRDNPTTVQSGWLKAPSNVSIYSYYGPTYPNWSADSYGPVSSCDYALAGSPIEPVASTQNAATAFVDLLNADRDQAGLVTYSCSSALEYGLTDSFEALEQTMVSYDPRESTATSYGMQLANDEFILSGRANAYGQRIMILLTDGNANRANGTDYGNPSTPVSVTFCGQQVSCGIYQAVATAMEEQTRRARQNGIRIYTVSFGQQADQVLMPLIARATKGAYYYAASHQDLTDIFRDIFYNLPAVLTR